MSIWLKNAQIVKNPMFLNKLKMNWGTSVKFVTKNKETQFLKNVVMYMHAMNVH